ncbi:hypothetical protein F0Q53_03695 [Anaplasma marginale]|uniref:Uncharacterized protein n=1 Tax=Anaplasma marginale TaxID=770 RepID=A0A643CKH9_ANAMA|nr:hypothetical protein [Anaplasma marginale]KAA8473059.1 hypothetical protein F0Q58_00110 [Anaplasma marginale]KAA8473898.1 hypothetical protein F0Q53_03695 [Anaplasma marginale]KAB0451418.1 hypothetical protein FY210_00110 [Anaplasma marginale]KAB0451580.1 hypothetical protein FY207_03875 [Anaplasma marginale]
MSWEQFLSGDDSPRRDVVLQVPEGGGSGIGSRVELILRLPLSLVLLATTLLLTTVTYVAMTVAMIVVLPVRFLAGFFSKRGRQASAGEEEEDREPVNGVRNFFTSLVKLVPVIVLWPVIAIFTSVPAMIVSTFMYVSSIVKSCVEYLTCAVTFGDPTKVGYLGRALYDSYVNASGIRAATDLAVGFFDESGPHAGATNSWNEVKSAVVDQPMDIMKSMLGGGLAAGVSGLGSIGGLIGGKTAAGSAGLDGGAVAADVVVPPAASLAVDDVAPAMSQHTAEAADGQTTGGQVWGLSV